MPGCSAIGCNNRSEKGFTMKCFPRDPQLRHIWKQRVGRAEWEPSNNSFLCHTHFESDQWLVSSNGKIKLKKGAVPSIFNITSTRKSTRKKLNSGTQIVEEDELGQYEVEYLENDAPLIFNTNNLRKISNSNNVPSKKSSTKPTQVLDNIKIVNSDENIIIFTDENNKQFGKFINGDNIIVVEKEKENVESLSKTNKLILKERLEVKKEGSENGSNLPDYDEIERKLQEICDPENEADESNIEDKNNRSDNLESPKKKLQEEITSNTQTTEKGIKRKPSIQIESTKKRISRKSSQTSETENQSHFTEDLSAIIINNLHTEDTAEYIIPNVLTDSQSIINMQSANKPINNKEILIMCNKDATNKCNKQIKNIDECTGVNNQKQIEQLNTKLNVQSEVIQSLGHQVIMYKDIEKKLQILTQKVQEQKKENEILIRKVTTKKLPVERKNKNDTFNLNDASEVDLKNRIEFLEEKNRSLNKSLALEDQNRKKLECQVKSRDNQIKELNWKLEKASKFLDRAEKNTNNYRRKVQTLQTQLKRKKCANGKNNTALDELLFCQSNESYSVKAFTIALDIAETCGTDGYEKLLNYRFPLPTLEELSIVYPGKADHCESSEEEIFEGREVRDSMSNTNEDSMIEIKMENVQYLDSDLISEAGEDVTCTVQDILNENSDHEDYNLNELKRHIKLNLDEAL